MSEKLDVVMIEETRQQPRCEVNAPGSSSTSQSNGLEAAACPTPRYGDPFPLGMMAYGTVFLCSSLLTLHAGNVTSPNLVLVFAMFYGGISQTLVGMWELFLGETMSATIFATYGGFNFTYGALYLPQLGLAAAYSVDGVPTAEFTRAIGLFLAIWAFVTAIFVIGVLRTTLPVVFTLSVTVISLTCLSASCFTGNAHLNTAGGAFGIIASCSSYYGAISMMYSPAVTFRAIRVPPVVLAYSA